MRLTIKKTGGFAGIVQTLASLDTERMPKAAADHVRKHVEEISTLAAQASESLGADQFIMKSRSWSRGLPRVP